MYAVHTIENELEDSPRMQGVVCIFCYVGHIILVFPITFFPLRLNLDGLIFSSARPLASDNLRFVMVSIGLVVIVILGAIFIPTIWVAFEFTGATVGVLLGFIFPASITLK